MDQVLVTAFAAYDVWSDNSSWLALLEFTRDLPDAPRITTRKYPVDFARAREQLFDDLCTPYDLVVLLGQAPGSPTVTLESTAMNLRAAANNNASYERLEAEGPVAFVTPLPLSAWAAQLRDDGIPAQVSHHAGTYLCNAVYYWAQWIMAQKSYPGACVFVHLPLAPQQVAQQGRPVPSLHTPLAAQAVRCIVRYACASSSF